jgi:hypothetical protein
MISTLSRKYFLIKILQSNIGNDDISVAVKSSNRIYIIIRRLVSVLSVLWFNIEIWPRHFLQEKDYTKNVRSIYGIIFQHWNMTPPPLSRERIPQKNIYVWDNFSTLKYDPSPLWPRKGFHKSIMYIWGHFSMLKKDCTKRLNVCLGSFYNVEIWSHHLSDEKIAQKC